MVRAVTNVPRWANTLRACPSCATLQPPTAWQHVDQPWLLICIVRLALLRRCGPHGDDRYRYRYLGAGRDVAGGLPSYRNTTSRRRVARQFVSDSPLVGGSSSRYGAGPSDDQPSYLHCPRACCGPARCAPPRRHYIHLTDGRRCLAARPQYVLPSLTPTVTCHHTLHPPTRLRAPLQVPLGSARRRSRRRSHSVSHGPRPSIREDPLPPSIHPHDDNTNSLSNIVRGTRIRPGADGDTHFAGLMGVAAEYHSWLTSLPTLTSQPNHRVRHRTFVAHTPPMCAAADAARLCAPSFAYA